MVANKRISESLRNDSPCRWWLHLFHKLIKHTKQALLGIAVLLMDGVHGDSGQSQHTSKCIGLCLDFKYLTDNSRNVSFIQRPIFERVSLCKRKAENSTPSRSPVGKFSSCIHFKPLFARSNREYRTCHFVVSQARPSRGERVWGHC